MTPTLKPDLPRLSIRRRSDWRRWLSRHHSTSPGVWVITVKKGALTPGDDYVSAIDLNEECLCYGWIDSKPARIDERHTALLCTPRKPGSGWSKVNKDRLERLIAADQVAPAGLDAIKTAQRDGSWTKLDDVDQLLVPDDLAAALKRHQPAQRNFNAFPPSTRRGILGWINAARTSTTRTNRVERTALLAQQNKRANQWPRT